MIEHTALKNIYLNKTIYILGAGASMNYLDASFFDDKITIGANRIWKFCKLSYNLIKHKQFIEKAKENNHATTKIVVSKHDCGDIDHELNPTKGVDYVFSHKKGNFDNLEQNFIENLDSIGIDDDIFSSASTITSCIHLAAYMGAKNIVLVGHDGGYIDGNVHVNNYSQSIRDFYKTEEEYHKYYNKWLELVSGQTHRLKDKLRQVYNCNIYSLNPFINFRLEGHTFEVRR